MRMLIAGLLKRSAMAAHNLMSQVVVSVAAAICVAIISTNYFEKSAPTPSASRTILAPAAPITLTRTGPSIGPSEPAPTVARLARVPVARPDPLHEQTVAKPALPNRLTAAKPAALEEQNRVVAVATKPAAMPARSDQYGTEVFSEPAAVAPLLTQAAEPPQRSSILGLPLPRFMPGYERVARSVEGARAKVGTLIEDIRD